MGGARPRTRGVAPCGYRRNTCFLISELCPKDGSNEEEGEEDEEEEGQGEEEREEEKEGLDWVEGCCCLPMRPATIRTAHF